MAFHSEATADGLLGAASGRPGVDELETPCPCPGEGERRGCRSTTSAFVVEEVERNEGDDLRLRSCCCWVEELEMEGCRYSESMVAQGFMSLEAPTLEVELADDAESHGDADMTEFISKLIASVR